MNHRAPPFPKVEFLPTPLKDLVIPVDECCPCNFRIKLIVLRCSVCESGGNEEAEGRYLNLLKMAQYRSDLDRLVSWGWQVSFQLAHMLWTLLADKPNPAGAGKIVMG